MSGMFRSLLAAAALMAGMQAYAIGVFNEKVTLYQPDGTTLVAVINGDEYAHVVRDESMHTLTQDSDGWWCYARYSADGTCMSTGWQAGRQAPAHILQASTYVPSVALRLSAGQKRREVWSRMTFPVLQKGPGTKASGDVPVRHGLIILAQFNDSKQKMTFTAEDFRSMISSNGYSRNGAAGSAVEYFNAQLSGDYTFEFTVSDIVTLSHESGYYFGDEGKNTDANAREAIAEACRLASAAGINFASFDNDGDGLVENVFVFVSGMDQARGGSSDCVWSHMSSLGNKYAVTIDGVTVNNYAISTELYSAGRFTSIGTFCHEFSHSLGLMDMYDTDYDLSGGHGNGLWNTTGLMDGGNYNNYGNYPPNYSALDYDCLGLGNPQTLVAGTYILEPVNVSRRYFKLGGSNPGEYYLIECRKAEGWDKYIGGSGLLIYHVDKSGRPAGMSDYYDMTMTAAQRWQYNEVNCRPDRQCAALISAMPGITAYSSSGEFMYNQRQVFYPYNKYDSFSAKTSPAFVFWNGEESPLAITGILFDGKNARFTVAPLVDVTLPEPTLGNTEVFQNSVIIQFEADDPTYEGDAFVKYALSSNPDDTKELKATRYASGKYAVTINGLDAETGYKANVFFRSYGVESGKVPFNFTTKRLSAGSYPYIFFGKAERNADGTFPTGVQIPLKVYNIGKLATVQWTFNNAIISTSQSGYYTITKSGTLRADVSMSDGTLDVIIKEITVK
mgnify:CR=1 FL=1